MTTAEKQFRYPGTRPFTEDDRLFFGRDEDIERLHRQIMVEKLIVLIGESGLGKSSLLNAGVVPLLKKKNNFLAVSMILGFARAEDITPSEFFLNKLSKLIDYDNFLWNKIAGNSKNEWLNVNLDECFWMACKSLQIQNPEQPVIFVLDQFEEVFTSEETSIERFSYLLSTLLHGQTPQSIKDHVIEKLKTDKTSFTKKEINLLFELVEIKIVISTRSDKMSFLNRLKKHIPQILQKTYELQPLSIKQANEAMLKPAKAEGEFISEAFTYHQDAEDQIINYLSSNKEKPIATFQLQLICQFCENLMIKQKADFPDSKNLIMADSLGDLNTIFTRHYDSIINEIADGKEQHDARLLIEENLIIEGNRVPLPDKVIISKHRISADLLQKLVNSRLLRSEPNNVGGFSYEISHDSLVAPIIASYKIRFDKEEKLRTQLENERKLRLAQKEAENLLMQREKERIENEKARKKQRKIIVLVSSVAVVALIALIFAIFSTIRASNEKNRAEKATIEAENNLKNFISAEVERKKTVALNMMDLEKYDVALNYLNNALKMDSTNNDIRKLIDECNKKAE